MKIFDGELKVDLFTKVILVIIAAILLGLLLQPMYTPLKAEKALAITQSMVMANMMALETLISVLDAKEMVSRKEIIEKIEQFQEEIKKEREQPEGLTAYEKNESIDN